MAEATSDFFERLGQRAHEPLLEKVTGSIRFDLVNDKKTDRWLVAVDKGDVEVSHKDEDADCLMRATEQLFDDMVRGEENVMAAVLRGAAQIEGDPELLILFQRLLPGPPASQSQRRGSNGQGSAR